MSTLGSLFAMSVQLMGASHTNKDKACSRIEWRCFTDLGRVDRLNVLVGERSRGQDIFAPEGWDGVGRGGLCSRVPSLGTTADYPLHQRNRY